MIIILSGEVLSEALLAASQPAARPPRDSAMIRADFSSLALQTGAEQVSREIWQLLRPAVMIRFFSSSYIEIHIEHFLPASGAYVLSNQ